MSLDSQQTTLSEQKQLEQLQSNYSALSTLTTVFFFWGFIASGNTVFIPFCKDYFHLDQFQSQLIDFAFYGAYYLGALALFLRSSLVGKDIVGSWGYKKTIIIGLLLSSVGAAAMIFSVYINVFTGMLLGLFIVALGFSLQQTSANPFMIILGDEKTGSTRITLGGAVNSFGTSIGPLVISMALFGTTAAISPEQIKKLSLDKVSILYACVGLLFLCVAVLFRMSKRVPSGIINDQGIDKSDNLKAVRLLLIMTGLLIICFSPVFYSYHASFANRVEQANHIRMIGWSAGLLVVIGTLLYCYRKGTYEKKSWGAMQYPQLTLGMLAIFIYVGVEVAIGSNLGEYLQKVQKIEASKIAPYVSMYWGSLMIGRWTGAVSALNISQKAKQILRFIVPLLAFGITLAIGHLFGYDVTPLRYYFLVVIAQIIAFYFTKDKPSLTLGIFSVLGVLSTLIGIYSTGIVSIYAFLSGGLFCSIMWPCIFSLALAGLGKHQTQGSGFLVMMILGGAIIPPLQGKLADIESISIQSSFYVGAICFAYLAFYAFYIKGRLAKQGILFD